MKDSLLGKKVLITGASGFLGSYLADALMNEGALLYGIDIRKPLKQEMWRGFVENGLGCEEVEELFSTNVFDLVYHLAGGASVVDSVADPRRDFDSLLPVTLNLLLFIKRYSPAAHFILFSSAAVYGNPEEFPITENTPIKPLSPYGIHKVLVEQLIQHYSTYLGFTCSVLRIFSAYGVGLRKQLFWDVMCKYKAELEKGSNKAELLLFGTGRESRDFICATEVAQAAIAIANRPHEKTFEIFNVANGVEIDIVTATGHLFANAEIRPDISFRGTNRPGDPERWRADISKLISIGFVPQNNLAERLSAYFSWHMQL